MVRPLSEELRTFFVNATHFKFKSLLFIIIGLLCLPFFFYKKIHMRLTKDFNNSFRYLMVYVINMYHLILLYNHKIYELDNGFIHNNDVGGGIGGGVGGIGGVGGVGGGVGGGIEGPEIRQRPIDILRRFIDQAGINLDGLVDIEIIQIEPDGLINNQVDNGRARRDAQNIIGGMLPLRNIGIANNGGIANIGGIANNGGIIHNAADTQNVHDTSVQSHINIAINALKKCEFKLHLSNGELLNNIRKHILNESKCFDDVKEKALTALKKIKKYNGLLTRLNISELEILHLVWNRIHSACNKDIMNTLKENLTLELADGVIDDDNVHCVQGRITRVLQCLQNADTEGILNIKPLWVIKEEIASIFGRYRQAIYTKLTPERQTIYDKVNPSKEELLLIEKINLKLRTHLSEYLTKKYVDTEIINVQQYETITKDYFAAIS